MLKRHGRPVPASFRNKKEPSEDNLFFWDAFWELSTMRQMGSVVGPIPYTTLLAFAQETGMVRHEFERFRGIIRAMDNVFLRKLNAKPDDGDMDLVSVNDGPRVSALLRRNAPKP